MSPVGARLFRPVRDGRSKLPSRKFSVSSADRSSDAPFSFQAIIGEDPNKGIVDRDWLVGVGRCPPGVVSLSGQIQSAVACFASMTEHMPCPIGAMSMSGR